MNTIIHDYTFEELRVTYLTDGGSVGIALTPTGSEASFNYSSPEPLVQAYIAGETYDGGYVNGRTMRNSSYIRGFSLLSHEAETSDDITTVTTILQNKRGHKLIHSLTYREGDKAIKISSSFINGGDEEVKLDLLSTFSLGCITPFAHQPNLADITLHRMRSDWSAEGRVYSAGAEQLNLERSWSGHGTRIEKWGQIGSMPVRGYFPFAGVTDDGANVTWAAQLEATSTWQLELDRRDEFYTLTGGQGDNDFGSLRRIVKTGERVDTPSAYLTAANGGLDAACANLQHDASRRYRDRHPEPLPLLYNEYCQSWGNPCFDSVKAAVEALGGFGVDYFVIDAGWFMPPDGSWSDSGGDWQVSQKLFPGGMKDTCTLIKAAGMKPGIWFEPETCACRSYPWSHPDMLVKRDGYPVTAGGRRFLDLRKLEVRAYLDERVAGLLADSGFLYMKADYNEAIGTGCDGSDSEGKGLTDVIAACMDFYTGLKERVPSLMLEACASGGHRIEPATMNLFDTASFSDAHECPEIPVIAANLHRLMAPAQEQIWAVVRPTDSDDRLIYTLNAASLGELCISGDIAAMSDKQRTLIKNGVDFYRSITDITLDGESSIYQRFGSGHYRSITGWQAVVRKGGEGIYIIFHGFGGELPATVTLPADGKIERIFASDGFTATSGGGYVTLTLPEKRNFISAGLLLK